MGKKLELGEPVIRGYLHYAYQLGILSRVAAARQWIYSNYIQLVCDERSTLVPLQFYMPNDAGYNWTLTCPLLEQQVISREMITDCNVNFLKFIKHAIDNEWYVVCHINEKYIKDTMAYQRSDFNHMMMVHGYDNEKGTVQVSGYNNKRQYASWEVPKDQFEEAFYRNKPDFLEEQMLRLYRVHRNIDDYDAAFELKPIAEGIKCFLLSQPPDRNIMLKNRRVRLTFGLNAYDQFIMYLEKVCNGEVRPNHIPLHAFMDHKLMMINRLKYIMEHRHDLDLHEYIRQYESYAQLLETARNVMLKSSIANKFEGVLDIIEDIKGLKIKEEQTLQRLVQVLD
jgi:hypothetical protein